MVVRTCAEVPWMTYLSALSGTVSGTPKTCRWSSTQGRVPSLLIYDPRATARMRLVMVGTMLPRILHQISSFPVLRA